MMLQRLPVHECRAECMYLPLGWRRFGVHRRCRRRDRAARAVARLLVDRDEACVARALAAVKTAIQPHKIPQGPVQFPAAAGIVTARNIVTHDSRSVRGIDYIVVAHAPFDAEHAICAVSTPASVLS
jgi:hypothetical protein